LDSSRPNGRRGRRGPRGRLAWQRPPSPAHACGGFFCNNNQPVNQAAERIIFSKNDDGTVTAVIQIMYQGPSEEFAWLLPVQGEPEVNVSSDVAFQRLQQATNPAYRLNTTVEGSCRSRFSGSSPIARGGSAGSADAGAPESDGNNSVRVVGEGSVGPYDYVTISVDNPDSEAVDVAIEWLRDNEYDVPDLGRETLGPYLASGMNLLAFRLTKGSDTGSIRPVRVRFGQGAPMIPIRPTAVAATDDMGVMVWVLGEHRAVPVNYKSLELNQALINWFNPGSNYNQVVTAAADEAGGQGFVTEMAGDASSLTDVVYPERIRTNWQSIQQQDWSDRHGELLQTVARNFTGWDGLRDVIRETVPRPDGVTEDEFLQCPLCYYDASNMTIEGFDPQAFLSSMQINVVEPVEGTQALFENRNYVTRMYTTMSADEMVKDPVFDFNADLGDKSRRHVADQTIHCSPSVTRQEAPWTIQLPQGGTVQGSGRSWPFDTSSDEMPANRRVRAIGTEGQGEVVEDNVASISAALDRHNARAPAPTASGGCTVGHSSDHVAPAAGLSLLVAVALGVTRRRRRH
jgi:MYXO-CTERM domain-containing protein